jgi:hypothetical protein
MNGKPMTRLAEISMMNSSSSPMLLRRSVTIAVIIASKGTGAEKG